MAPEVIKRKTRKCFTIQQKGEILNSIDKGISPTELCRKYGVEKSTISGIKKKRSETTLRVAETYITGKKRI